MNNNIVITEEQAQEAFLQFQKARNYNIAVQSALRHQQFETMKSKVGCYFRDADGNLFRIIEVDPDFESFAYVGLLKDTRDFDDFMEYSFSKEYSTSVSEAIRWTELTEEQFKVELKAKFEELWHGFYQEVKNDDTK